MILIKTNIQLNKLTLFHYTKFDIDVLVCYWVTIPLCVCHHYFKAECLCHYVLWRGSNDVCWVTSTKMKALMAMYATVVCLVSRCTSTNHRGGVFAYKVRCWLNAAGKPGIRFIFILYATLPHPTQRLIKVSNASTTNIHDTHVDFIHNLLPPAYKRCTTVWRLVVAHTHTLQQLSYNWIL